MGVEAFQTRLIDEQIFERVTKELAKAPDFVGEPKARFEQLVFRLIRFHGDRANALAARYPYLRSFIKPADAPLESALQQDLFDCLLSAGYGAKVEVSDVAAGRSDIYVHFGRFSFVIECKRLLDPWSDGATRPFVEQTGAYQQGDITLGVLAVLDLSRRAPGDPHVRDCFSVRVSGATDRRTIVTMRLPGNKTVPSSVATKMSKAKGGATSVKSGGAPPTKPRKRLGP